MALQAEKQIPREYNHEWLLLLAYIGAKRTQEPTFRKLFNKLLEDKQHVCHGQAKELQMRYDFTPLNLIVESVPSEVRHRDGLG